MTPLNSKLRNLAFTVLASVALAACQPLTTSGSSSAVDYRYERFTEIQETANYNQCRKTAFSLDREAGFDNSKFLASAKKFEKCELSISGGESLIDKETRLKTIAMGVQNFIKGGDLTSARRMLEHFETVADGHDLYYTDSASFVDSMSVLLNASQDKSSIKLASQNAKGAIKDEIRRVWYWQAN